MRRRSWSSWAAARRPSRSAEKTSARKPASSRQAPGGSIVSVVRDKSGRPIPAAIVSAIGRRIVTGVTDSEGRCTFTALPPGDYLVRVHRPGFISASSLLVLGGPGVSTTWSFVLKPQPAVFLEEDSPRSPNGVLAAGVIVGDGAALQPPPPSASRTTITTTARRRGVFVI